MSFNNEIFNQDAFKNIEPEKIAMIQQFINNVQGKNINEVMLEFMSFYKKMPKGRELSSQEKEALINAIYSTLSPNDREKLKKVLTLIGNK